MNDHEVTRIIKALESAGWTGDEIKDFLVYVASGDEDRKPTKDFGKGK